MRFVEVKLIKDISNDIPPKGYLSWLDYWEKKKGLKAKECEFLLCVGEPVIGAKIVKINKSMREYILPICSHCNLQSEDKIFEAWECDLVPVIMMKETD